MKPVDKEKYIRYARKKKEMMHHLVIRLVLLERKYLAMIKKSALLNKITHSYLFSFQTHALSRGIAIGMFWGFMPMPFQMLPAFLFCWLALANLPIAILCVWISNPLTYLPIFYIEYKVGSMLFHADEGQIISFNEFSQKYQNVFAAVGDIYQIILEGALVIGSVLAVLGYLAGFPLSYYLARFSKRRFR